MEHHVSRVPQILVGNGPEGGDTGVRLIRYYGYYVDM